MLYNFVYATIIQASYDILFFKNDTLKLNKIHTDKILKVIVADSSFKKISSPKSINWYTAYWVLENDSLFLISITNCASFNGFCSLKNTDTINLYKHFGLDCKKGKVYFPVENDFLLAFDKFKLREGLMWPIFYKDYYIKFKFGKIQKIDTVLNYIDDKEKLNRITKIDIEEKLYERIKETMNNQNFNIKNDLKFNITIVVTGDGNLEYVDFILENNDVKKDYLSLKRHIKIVESDLKQLEWDTIKGIRDECRFSFTYSTSTNSFADIRFENDILNQKKYQYEFASPFLK